MSSRLLIAFLLLFFVLNFAQAVFVSGKILQETLEFFKNCRKKVLAMVEHFSRKQTKIYECIFTLQISPSWKAAGNLHPDTMPLSFSAMKFHRASSAYFIYCKHNIAQKQIQHLWNPEIFFKSN